MTQDVIIGHRRAGEGDAGDGGRRAEPFPIAVVGIGCRFPGARGPREFWRLLREGRDTVTEVPRERFAAAGYRAALGDDGLPLLSSAAGGFLDGIDEFDADFFGISPYEAARMDPQQRLFLETAWEAVEDAGLPPGELAGSRTGVYVAQLTTHYWDELYRAGVWDMHAMVGAQIRGALPARVAHVLDLHGPAVTVDASCASGLMAVHLACQGLRLGELDAALVGGTNLVTAPEDGVGLSQGTLLSPSGRCRFGDVDADGFVRSEGVAAIVLKPLERALADGDRVYSVILGGAASNDGKDNGLTPSEAGQQEMLRAAYAAAGVSPREVQYVEAHGAGTQVGDRTELSALAAVLGAGRDGRDKLLVGSVKSNIGHTESTSGLAGLIKVSLALRHGEIPPTLHVRRPNPGVDWRCGGLRLVRRRAPWPRAGRRALAGINSFGISGANVHIVLAEPPQPSRAVAAHTEAAATSAVPRILPISARSGAALAELERGYLARLTAADAARELPDLCHTAAVRRAHHRFRRAVVGGDAGELAARLRAEDCADGAREQALSAPTVVYVFPGLGAQWTGMARELLEQCPPFARAMREYDAAIRAEAGWSVLELLASDDPLTDVGLAQPAVWAVECALAAVWRHWGVAPDLAIGHSMGEVAAATVSGALTVADAAAVMCRRSDLMRRAGERGGLASVQLGYEAAGRLADRYPGRAAVAVSNSPNSSVLAADLPVLDEIESDLARAGVYFRRVNARVAAHSPAMDPLLDDLRELLREVRPAEGAFPLQSTVHCGRTLGAEMDAEYWVDNLRERVRFCEAVQRVLADGRPVLFIEMSPHPLLAHSLQECVDDAGAPARVVSCLRRTEPGLAGLLEALGQAYAQGAEPDWRAVTGDGGFLAPPPYPWQRRSFGVADARPTVPARLIAGAGSSGLTQGSAMHGRTRVASARAWRVPVAAEVGTSAGLLGAIGLAAHAVAEESALEPELAAVQLRPDASAASGGEVLVHFGGPSRDALEHGVGTRWQFEVEASAADGTEATAAVLASGALRLAPVREPQVRDLAATRAWYGEPLSGEAFAQRFGGPGTGSGSALADGPRVLKAWRRLGESLALVAVPGGTSQALDPMLWPVYRDLLRAAVPSTHALSAGPLELSGADTIRVLRPVDGLLWIAARLEYGRDDELRGTVLAAGRDRSLVFEAGGLAVAGVGERSDTAVSLRAERAASRRAHYPSPVASPAVPRSAASHVSAQRAEEALSAAEIQFGMLEQAARLLGLTPEQIDPDRPMTALGVDSLLAMDLRRRLQKRLGVSISPRAVLSGGTLRELALLAHSGRARRP